MDPITLATISATVGVASGKLVEKAWDSGERWITSYYKDHEQKALEQAKTNSLEFLADLAQRVGELEEAAGDDQNAKRHIESALGDPDFSALLKDAMIASARTRSKDKQELLARIVSERLRVETDDLLALASSMACAAVQNLTPKQIRFLALADLVYHVRPSAEELQDIAMKAVGSRYKAWLERNISDFLPLDTPTPVELQHLQATGCVNYLAGWSRILEQRLSNGLASVGIDSVDDWPYEEFINGPVGSQFHQLWQDAIQKIALTTVGQLIGVYTLDESRGGKTVLTDW